MRQQVATASSISKEVENPLQDAAERLSAAAERRLDARDVPNSLRPGWRRQATVDVEIAGPFVPMTAPTLEEAAAQLDPARDGLALRMGDTWHVRFPAVLRMTGAAATLRTLHELAATAGRTPDALDTDRRLGRAALYRFRTIDLRQAPGDRLPEPFERGALPPPLDVTASSVAELRRAIGRHLLRHMISGPQGELWMAGTYHPESDEWIPIQAPDRDAALAMLALDRLLDDPELGDRARRTAAVILEQLDQSDPVVAAMCHVIDDRSDVTPLFDSLADANTPPIDRAVLAWATAPSAAAHPAWDAWCSSLETLTPRELDQLQPWALWAAARRGAECESAWSAALIKRLQSRLDLSRDSINAGFGASLLRLAASLPAAQAPPEAVVSAVRMVHALAMNADDSRYFPSPDTALGGVRDAIWSERMSVWVQAMAILLLDDTLRVLTAAEQEND